jgi:hypothetical protein
VKPFSAQAQHCLQDLIFVKSLLLVSASGGSLSCSPSEDEGRVIQAGRVTKEIRKPLRLADGVRQLEGSDNGCEVGKSLFGCAVGNSCEWC